MKQVEQPWQGRLLFLPVVVRLRTRDYTQNDISAAQRACWRDIWTDVRGMKSLARPGPSECWPSSEHRTFARMHALRKDAGTEQQGGAWAGKFCSLRQDRENWKFAKSIKNTVGKTWKKKAWVRVLAWPCLSVTQATAGVQSAAWKTKLLKTYERILSL